ncbi:MAG: DUF4365 domain-containing protein [Trebonia sp.]
MHRAVATAALGFTSMGWAFREQPALDLGVDALAEEVHDGFLTGRLIALVIKAGRAFFSKPDGDGWLYGGRNEELSYWLSYSLPVVLLAHHPDTGLTYWQHLTPHAVTYSSSSWEIRIPAEHVLGADARQALTAIARGTRPRGHWAAAARTVARAEAITSAPVGQPSPEGFRDWVGTLVDRFQHAVENTDLWRVLWDDKLVKPRNELIVHASAAAMWNSLCELADIDMSREPDAGRGPVDFKFSAGWPPCPHRSQAPVQLQAAPGRRRAATSVPGKRAGQLRLLRLRRVHRPRLPPGAPRACHRHLRRL